MNPLRLVSLLVTLGVLGSASFAQIPYYPESQAWAEGIALTYAAEAGHGSLAAAIGSGNVQVFAADLSGEGKIATSGPSQDGTFTVLVHYTPDGSAIGPGVVHEFTHQLLGHTPNEPGCDPNDQQLVAIACQECEAHCETIAYMALRWAETGLKPPCWVRNDANNQAGWNCLICASGVGANGPPIPEPCGSASGVPCTP